MLLRFCVREMCGAGQDRMGDGACMRKRSRISVAMLLFGSTAGFGMSPELTADQARILDLVRTSALAYSHRLPDFICTQITHRETSTAADWAGTVRGGGSTSVIEERLTFIGKKRTTRSSRWMGGWRSDWTERNFMGR